MAKTTSRVSALNLRGQLFRDSYIEDQLVTYCNEFSVGCIGLTEISQSEPDSGRHGRTIRDAAGDCWTVLSHGTTRVGFLVSYKYKVLHFETVGPRVAFLQLAMTEDAFWRSQLALCEPCMAGTIGLVVVYAPTESRGSEVDLDSFWTSVSKAVKSVEALTKSTPLVVGDFNVNVGACSTPADWGYITGRGVSKRVPSRNCDRLFQYCADSRLCVANSFFTLKKSLWSTWYHPRTGTAHMKDLILCPYECLKSLSTVQASQAVVAGNNDHAVIEARFTTRWSTRCSAWKPRGNGVTATRGALQKGGRHRQGRLPNRTACSGLRGKELRSWNASETKRLSEEVADALRGLEPGWSITRSALEKTLARSTKPAPMMVNLPERWQECSNKWSRLHEKLAKARKAMKENPTVRSKAHFFSALSRFRGEREKAKAKLSMTLQKAALASNPKMAKLARGMLAGVDPSEISGNTGTSQPDPETFAGHFEQLFSRQSVEVRLGVSSSTDNTNYDLENPPSLQEVKDAIDGLASGKASGSDGLPAEVFKSLKPVLAPRLCDDFRKIWEGLKGEADQGDGVPGDIPPECDVPQEWRDAEVVTLFKKGNRLDPANYRGIFLLDVAGKILSALLAARIGNLAESFLSDEQNGFRRRRSTAHGLFVLRRLQEEVRRANVPLAGLFIDFKKAFDSPPREAILECLRAMGVPPVLVNIVGRIHEGSKAKVRGTKAWFQLLRGVRQGCVLGPLLFNILLEFVLRKCSEAFRGLGVSLVCTDKPNRPVCPEELRGIEFRVGHGAYADDLFLVGNLIALQSALSKLQSIAGSIGLNVSAGKTEWLWLHKGDDEVPTGTALNLDGEVIRQVRTFSFLGSLVTDEGGCSLEIRNRIRLSEQKLIGLRWIFHGNIRRRRVIRLVAQYIWPVLLYGCEAWTLSVRDLEVIEAFLNKVRLRILGRFRYVDGETITNTELRGLVKIPSAASLIIERQLSFALKLMRGDSSITAWRMMYAEVKEEVRWIGGRGRHVYPKTLLANLLYLSRLADNEAGHVALERFDVPDLVEHMLAVVESPSTESTVRLWESLVQLDSKVGGKVSCRLIRSLVRSAESEHVISAPTWVMLSEFEHPARYQCEHCRALYVEHKALLRHVRQAHELAPPSQSVDAEGSRFQCLHCNMSYKTSGWLARHVRGKHPEQPIDPKTSAHKVVGDTTFVEEAPGSPTRARSRGPFAVVGVANKEVVVAPAPGSPTRARSGARGTRGPLASLVGVASKSNTLEVAPQNVCWICGKGGKVKEWSVKTLKNHMAKAHQVNAVSGEASRRRIGKVLAAK